MLLQPYIPFVLCTLPIKQRFPASDIEKVPEVLYVLLAISADSLLDMDCLPKLWGTQSEEWNVLVHWLSHAFSLAMTQAKIHYECLVQE